MTFRLAQRFIFMRWRYESKVQMMVASGTAHTTLHIYVHNRRVAHLNNPAIHSIFDWLERLDGEYVTKLVLTNGKMWLNIDIAEENLSFCICNDKMEICFSELVSRQDAPHKVLQFLEDKVL